MPEEIIDSSQCIIQVSEDIIMEGCTNVTVRNCKNLIVRNVINQGLKNLSNLELIGNRFTKRIVPGYVKEIIQLANKAEVVEDSLPALIRYPELAENLVRHFGIDILNAPPHPVPPNILPPEMIRESERNDIETGQSEKKQIEGERICCCKIV